MEGQTAVNLAAVGFYVPFWSLISGSLALIAFGSGLATLGLSVRKTVKSNIDQNNANHARQMAAISKNQTELTELLEQIICLNQEQLYAIGKAGYTYNGKCERLRP